MAWSVSGTITPASVGSGATVALSGVGSVTADSNGNYSFSTVANGNYTVTHLIPDVYRIRIEATGFKATEIANIQVSADTAARLDSSLQVGEVTQSVEVTGEIPQLKTDRADVSTVLITVSALRDVSAVPSAKTFGRSVAIRGSPFQVTVA